MRFTGSVLLAISAAASLIFPTVLGDCHFADDDCDLVSNHNTYRCNCANHHNVVRYMMPTLS